VYGSHLLIKDNLLCFLVVDENRSGRNLPENFVDNLEALLRKKRTCAPASSAIPLTTTPLMSVLATTTTTMA
jgi:hypothetical protein